MKEIRRDKAVAFKFDTEAEQVGVWAAELLGYKGVEQAREKQEGLAPLAAVLARLAIDPLNAQDVVRYQRERVNELTAESVKAWMARQMEKPTTDRHVETFIGAQWNAIDIKNYKRPVPVQVLEKLVRIKEACPEAIVEIVELSEHPDPFSRVSVGGRNEWERKETFWIDVWDEPRFGRAPDDTNAESSRG